ncbi:uncharacterized protein METZ01_LOCUS122117 [marine metagenome]|uniref:Uncharacterized protein n=1 Tax=marine metagenome TaxID=408172 RepID=A0A381XYG1_9ZZZZ
MSNSPGHGVHGYNIIWGNGVCNFDDICGTSNVFLEKGNPPKINNL